MLEGGGLAELNKGIAPYRLEQIKPTLRPELDRRISASANLIQLNRQQAIDKTLQRFSGWSTSIPPGGVSIETKREVKTNIRKPLQSQTFEERRVLIDQGHKLISSINEIVATDGGAIAGLWRSHWREANYDYREDHKERDQQVYLIRDSWADQAGLVRKGGRPYYDEIDAVGQAPFCRCFIVWIYALRDLPADMLTAKGRDAMTAAHSSARTDDAAGKLSKSEAGYLPVWPTRQTQCRRCSMFRQDRATEIDNACTLVAGDINACGHCQMFEISGARADAAEREPVPAIGAEATRRRLERLEAQLARLSAE
jgi:hypothetical protein